MTKGYIKFPPVESADENGLLALGGDLSLSTLKEAYLNGIFPWPISDEFPLAWFSPDPRGILFFDNLKINKRLKRYLKNTNLKFYANRDFYKVIHSCAQVVRKGQNGTWITDDIIAGYINLFNNELAYSIEAYDGDQLVGGVYGVSISGLVSGESMFCEQSNASKMCLIVLLGLLNRSEVSWLDTQMVTPIVKDLGGIEIDRSEYLKLLGNAPLKSTKQIFPSHDKEIKFSELFDLESLGM